MGRKQKYKTEEEKLNARRERQMRYYFKNQQVKKRGIASKVRRGINIGRRGFKQYVMNESASMSQTRPMNTGPGVMSRIKNFLRRNQPNSS